MPRRSFQPPWDRCLTIWGPGSTPLARHLDAGPAADLEQRRPRNRNRPSETCGKRKVPASVCFTTSAIRAAACSPIAFGAARQDLRSPSPAKPRGQAADLRIPMRVLRAPRSDARKPDGRDTAPPSAQTLRVRVGHAANPACNREFRWLQPGSLPAGCAPGAPLHARTGVLSSSPAHPWAFRPGARLPSGPEDRVRAPKEMP